MLIEDGTGSGRTVKVDSENRMEVHAVTQVEVMHENLRKSQAYTVFGTSTPTYLDPSAETGNLCVFYMKNTDEKNIVISQMGIWTASNQYVEPMTNPTGIPINTETLSPTNMNLSSGNIANGTFLSGSSIEGIIGGTRVSRFRIPANNATNFNDLDSKIIIPKNNIFTLFASEADVAIEFTFNFYYIPKDD